MLQFAALLFVTLFLPILAYIPATPTNSTRNNSGGLKITDASTILLQWYSHGIYAQNISYQIVGKGSTGISKGALVHFSEDGVKNSTSPTSTPWIALISCDKNSTNSSFETDIFHLAREKGAVSALLYSLYSTACVVNPEYSNFSDQVFDIFSTPNPSSSRLIEYQFSQIGNGISSYDSAQLNASASVIMESINTGYPVSSGYLLAALTAHNATEDNSTPAPTKSGSKAHSTPFPMMMLYITMTCVLALPLIL